jgi:hypothetical protein
MVRSGPAVGDVGADGAAVPDGEPSRVDVLAGAAGVTEVAGLADVAGAAGDALAAGAAGVAAGAGEHATHRATAATAADRRGGTRTREV